MILPRGRERDSHDLGKVLPTLVKHQQLRALPHPLFTPLQGSGYGTSQRSLDNRNKLKQRQRLHRVQQKQCSGLPGLLVPREQSKPISYPQQNPQTPALLHGPPRQTGMTDDQRGPNRADNFICFPFVPRLSDTWVSFRMFCGGDTSAQ